MVIQLKQTDTGVSIVHKLQDLDGTQDVDLTGATVKFVMGDKSRTIVFSDATIVDASKGEVSYTFYEQDTLVAGVFNAEFEVTFQNGNKKIYPREGYIGVSIQENIDTTNREVIIDAIAVRQGEFTQKLDTILGYLGGEDIAGNEELRKANETSRVNAESTRQLQETQRQTNTATAIANAEAATASANTATASANEVIITAGTAATFAQEQGTFAKTQGEFAQAQGTFAQTEVVNLATIKAEAEAATTGATTAAIGANTAKANAETATLNANIATTNANTATTNANNAATYATEQGNYAKAQGEAAQAIIESGTVSSVNTKTGAVVLTATDVGAIPTTEKGTANGVATLGADGKVPQEQLDINIDTSTLATKDDLSSLATKDSLDNLAGVGRTTETVKGNADALALHQADETNPHSVTKEQVGLGNVDNVKQASKADFDNHTGASKVGAHYAKNIALEDTANNFVSTEIEGAMAELFTNVSNGKALVGTAITDVDPNVSVPTEPSFSDLATAIGSISVGKKWASGTVTGSASTLNFTYYNGSTKTHLYVNVTGLNFTPSYIIIRRPADPTFLCIYDGGETNTNYSIKMIYTSNVNYWFKKDGVSASVTSTGFQLPVTNAVTSGTYTWVAYE